MSKKIKYKGKSVEDAISKACKALNLTSNELAIEVVSAGSAGIFGLCKKQAVISVSRKNSKTGEKNLTKAKSEKPPSEPEAAPQPGVEEKTPDNTGPAETPKAADSENTPSAPEKEIPLPDDKKKTKSDKKSSPHKQPLAEPSVEMINEIETVLNRLLALMNFSADLSIVGEPGKVTVEITSDYSEYLVGGDGQPIDGLQYIIRKIIGKKFPEKIIIFLDSDGFRARRKKELEETARKLAEEVKTTRKNRTITSLNPAERRIVHMALQEDKAIRSRSIGDGLFKKILIYPPGQGRKKSTKGNKGRKKNA